MKYRLIAALFLATPASLALATSPENDASVPAVERLLRGHAEPGEVAQSQAGDVTFKVLPSGIIEKTNGRHGTVEYLTPLDPRIINNVR